MFPTPDQAQRLAGFRHRDDLALAAERRLVKHPRMRRRRGATTVFVPLPRSAS
jgi:hypothetical protein